MTMFLYDKTTEEVKQTYTNVLKYSENEIVYIEKDEDENPTTFYASVFPDNIEFAVGDTFETAQKELRYGGVA